jgi:hypothetical protein
MSLACPNKNSKEWKTLVSQTGENLANLAFVANNFQMPDVKSATEIKKEIGYKKQMENYAGFSARLRKYNAKHGTSHSFTATKAWGNTFDIEMKYNYLPVNVEKQRQRMEARKEPLYVENLSTQSFKEVYPSQSKGSEQLNLFESDDLIANAADAVTDAEQLRIKKLYSEVLKQKDALTKVSDVNEEIKILANISGLRELIDIAEGRIITSQNIEGFEDVLMFANSQISEISNLLRNPAISADDINYANRIINLWTKAGDFSTEPHEHIILDEYEFNTDSIREQFRLIAAKAEDLRSTLTKIEKENVTKFTQQYTSGKLNQEEIFKHLKDVSKVSSMTLNLGRLKDPMLQSIFSSIEQAGINAQQDANEIWKDLDKLTTKFLAKSPNGYNILKQITESGNETGRLVHRFSPEFYETRNNLMSIAFDRRNIKTGSKKSDPVLIKQYFEWLNKNTISFDPRILFPDSLPEDSTMPAEFVYNRVQFSEADKSKHIQELKFQLGEKGYEEFLERAQKKIDKYQKEREGAYMKSQLNANLNQDEKDAQFSIWLRENSPYWAMDMKENPSMRIKADNSYYAPRGLRNYVVQAPRRTVDGKPTKWYDKNYEKIEADEDLKAYHDYVLRTLNQLKYILPPNKQALMGVGVLPTMEKTMMDIFNEKGLMMGIVPFWDKLKQLQTTTDFAKTVYSDIDPLTGDIAKNLQVQHIVDTNAQAKELVKEMSIKYKQQTGKTAGTEERKQFREQALDILSKEKSWDVSKILKAYSLTVLAHKHKSIIEPQIKLAERAFKSRKELVSNKAGQPQNKPKGGAVTEEGLDNYKKALDFFLDSTFYGVGSRKVEGVTDQKLYTKAEEIRKKELEELLANEEDPESREFLQSQINNLGGFRTLSGTGDAVLKLMTLKGLGWNLASAFSNIGFGTISNYIEAADGRLYTLENLNKGYMLTTNSIGRNVSADVLFNDPNGTATKIRSIMDDWDILQTSANEMYDNSQKSSFSKLKRFGPYTLQQRSEYVNQAPIMIAVLLQYKAKSPSGEEVSLWDAFGPDAKLKEGYTTEEDITAIIQKIRRIIEMNHGDYNNQLMVKETFAGRALTQFRTWMFEGFANRFEAESEDHLLSYGLEETFVRKGRYRSYTKGQLTTTGAAIGTAVLPGIGTAIGAGIGYLGGKFFGMQTGDSALQDTLYSLKQLARKLMFMKTTYGDKFSKVDAANMRKNMMELHIMLGLMGLALLFKAMADDDDDEDMVANFLLNQTIRLRTDIGFYTNPLEFEKLTKTAVPMAGLIQDVSTVTSDIFKFFNDDTDDDVFESGPFKDDAKFLVHAGELIPGTAQGIRLYRMGETVFDK